MSEAETHSQADPSIQISAIGAAQVDEEIVAAFARLLPQLSASYAPPTADELRAIARADSNILFVARDTARGANDGAAIVGTLTLVVFRTPTGARAFIEDVIVDGDARGRGVGAALSRAAIERARAMRVKSINLTSNPAREAANRLYQRIGFVSRQTNVYRLAIEDES